MTPLVQPEGRIFGVTSHFDDGKIVEIKEGSRIVVSRASYGLTWALVADEYQVASFHRNQKNHKKIMVVLTVREHTFSMFLDDLVYLIGDEEEAINLDPTI